MDVTALDIDVQRNPVLIRTGPKPVRPAQVEDESRKASPTATPQSETAPTADLRDGDKVPGVIRRLEEGHFRGVADVRLRINFFEQLSARATASAQPVVEQGAGELIDTVRGELDALLGTLAVDESQREQIGGLVEEFDAAVQAAVEQFSGNGAIDTEALTGAIEGAFNTLVEQLQELLTAPVPEPEPQTDPNPPEPTGGKNGETPQTDTGAEEGAPTADGTPAVVAAVPTTEDPVDEPASSLDDALAALRETFTDALSVLTTSIQSATQLADPSPPHGNGVAYNKFLAIYDGLRGLTAGDVDVVG